MMKRRLLVAALLMMLAPIAAVPTSAQQRTERDARLKQWLKQYPEADANRDGVLTLEEAQKYREKLLSQPRARQPRQTIPPTHANVQYGPHERNVFDLWLPTADANSTEKPIGPLPVYVFFHGGGFVAGDKSSFDPSDFWLPAWPSLRAITDSLTVRRPSVPLRCSMRRCAIQFLRLHAKRWNLDDSRIAVSGSSAGAVISMWIGYHDDLAIPSSEDPVARQSSRVKCIIPINGPTNLDPQWITRQMGGPKHIHGSYPKMFVAPVSDSERPEVRKRIMQSSPVEHVSADDPPSLLIYTGKVDGIPLPESASTGVLIHHAYFGKTLKQRLDAKGVVNRFLPSTDPRQNGSKVILEWLQVHL